MFRKKINDIYLSREFGKGLPMELLCADDLAIAPTISSFVQFLPETCYITGACANAALLTYLLVLAYLLRFKRINSTVFCRYGREIRGHVQ